MKKYVVVLMMLLVATVSFATDVRVYDTFVDGASIELSQSNSTWSFNGDTEATWLADIHAILGETGDYDSTTASVRYSDTYLDPLIQCGFAPTDLGMVVYKFTAAPGEYFDGGTITSDVWFQGTPSTQGAPAWFGVGTYFDLDDAQPFRMEQDCANTYTKEKFTDESYPAGWYGTELRTLQIPSGVSEFYVVYADQQGETEYTFSSANIGYHTLSVDAVVVPEPATMILLGLGGVLLRKKRS